MTTANRVLLLITSGVLLIVGAALHLRRRQLSTVLAKLASKDPLADQVHFKPKSVRIRLKLMTFGGS